MKKFFYILFFYSSFAFAQERITVKVPSNEEQQVQTLLENLKNAVDNENSRQYLSCFTKELADKNKKRTVLMFMQNDMSMEIEKFDIIDSNDDFVEFMAKYTFYENEKPFIIVSSVLAKKENNELLISKEEIVSKSRIRSGVVYNDIDDGGIADNRIVFAPIGDGDCADGNCPLPKNQQNNQQNACPNGNCRLLPNTKHKPKFNKQGQEVLEGIAGFNDENGNPDPNGVMWIDPVQLLARFPDKYGVPACMREQIFREAQARQNRQK